MNSQESLPQPPGKLTGLKRFAQVAKKTGMQSVVANTLIAGATQPNRLSSVLNPENRRLLDLQGQRSPEVQLSRCSSSCSGVDKSSSDVARVCFGLENP